MSQLPHTAHDPFEAAWMECIEDYKAAIDHTKEMVEEGLITDSSRKEMIRELTHKIFMAEMELYLHRLDYDRQYMSEYFGNVL